MIDVEQRLREELDRLTSPVPKSDWDAVVAAAGAGGTTSRRRRASLAALAVAGLVVLAAATPLGAAIAHGLGGFSSWLTGEPGRPASTTQQQAFAHANARSWLGFPSGTKLRELETVTYAKTGDTVDLLGFRSGSTLCLRVVVSGRIQKSAQSCAPLTALESSSAPVDVLLIDQGFGRGTKHAWYGLNRFTAPALRLTAGIAADGVRSVTLNDLSGPHTVPVVANAFLYVAVAPAVDQLVKTISARTAARVVTVPFAPALFGFGGFAAGVAAVPAAGPTSIQHRASGGTIAWLDRRMPVGQPLAVVPGGMRWLVQRHAVFGRVLAPDPGLLYRIAVTLNTSRHGHKATGVCTWLIGNGSGVGAGAGSGGGGCAVRATLFADSPLTWGVGIAGGSQEFATVSGLASDDVARITAFLSGGQTQPVPLADNAYIAVIARSAFPVRLVAYNRAGQVIGFALPGLGGVTGQVAPAPGRARLLERVTSPTGAWAALYTGPATSGGTCVYIHQYQSKNASGNEEICGPSPQGVPAIGKPRAIQLISTIGNPAAILAFSTSPNVATIVIHYKDGAHTSIRPIDEKALYAIPLANLSAGHQFIGATALSNTGTTLGSETYPPPRSRR